MAASESLNALATSYRQLAAPARITDLQALADDYSTVQIAAFLDVAALGFAFDVVLSEPAFDASHVTPDMARAWSAAYPKVSIESLHGLQRESFAGIIGGWKCRLFLVETASQLNHGGWVGNLHLEAGQRAKIPDLDLVEEQRLQIVSEDAAGATPVQSVALHTLGEFLHSLGLYSDVPLFATYEIVTSGAGGPGSPEDPVDTSFGHAHFLRLATAAVARIRAERVFFAAPKLYEFIRSLTRCMAVHNTEDESALIRNARVPDLNRLLASASSFAGLVRCLEACYPCPERQEKEKRLATAGGFAEVLSLVDASTRLAILCGSIPLDRWIESMVVLDTSMMNESELARHLADLQQIRADGLVDKAFAAEGFRERWANAMAGGRKQLAERLDNSIEAGALEMKKFSGVSTSVDAERIMLLRDARYDTLVEIQNEHQRKSYRFMVRPRSVSISASNDSRGFGECNASWQTSGMEDSRVLAFAATLDDSVRTASELER